VSRFQVVRQSTVIITTRSIESTHLTEGKIPTKQTVSKSLDWLHLRGLGAHGWSSIPAAPVIQAPSALPQAINRRQRQWRTEQGRTPQGRHQRRRETFRSTALYLAGRRGRIRYSGCSSGAPAAIRPLGSVQGDECGMPGRRLCRFGSLRGCSRWI
jgi:hypothetical protein